MGDSHEWEAKHMSDDGCFELDLATIEGLVSRGFLANSARHDMDAVEQALQAFLRYEFGGKRPANPSSVKPIGDVPQFPPVATVIVSPEGRAALSELVVEQTLVALVNAKMLSPLAAVDILTRVEKLGLERASSTVGWSRAPGSRALICCTSSASLA
jgi:hypothetical protein